MDGNRVPLSCVFHAALFAQIDHGRPPPRTRRGPGGSGDGPGLRTTQCGSQPAHRINHVQRASVKRRAVLLGHGLSQFVGPPGTPCRSDLPAGTVTAQSSSASYFASGGAVLIRALLPERARHPHSKMRATISTATKASPSAPMMKLRPSASSTVSSRASAAQP